MTSALIALIDRNFESALGKKAELKASATKCPKKLDELTHAKLFEVVALSQLLSRLKSINSACTFELMNGGVSGNQLILQSAPGMADPSRSHIRVQLGGKDVATIWNNVEFEGISSASTASGAKSGSYHEADILMVRPTAHRGRGPVRPKFGDVLVVIECKFLGVLPKVVLRGLLGLRREMSMYAKAAQPTELLQVMTASKQNEFAAIVNAHPSSHLIFFYPDKYKFDPEHEWQAPANQFGIEFWAH